MSKIIEKLRKSIPLRTRLKVTNEMLIHSYLIDNGYIPDGYWSDEKEEKYGKSFRALAGKIADASIEDFNKWEKDGKHTMNKQTRQRAIDAIGEASGDKSNTDISPPISPKECKHFDEAQGRNYCVNHQIDNKRCIGTMCGHFEKKQ